MLGVMITAIEPLLPLAMNGKIQVLCRLELVVSLKPKRTYVNKLIDIDESRRIYPQ